MRLVPFFLTLMVAGPAFAQNVSPDMVCFIRDKSGRLIDLESLCGVVPAAPTTTPTSATAPSSLPVPAPPGATTPSTPTTTPLPPTAASPSTGADSGLSGGGSSGQCNSPDDRASDGSRCGGRAASERSGGR